MKKCFVLLITCIFVLASCSSKEESYTLNEEKYGNHYGRDYGGHVGDGKFFMMRFADVDELLIAESPDSFGVILTREYKHKFDGNDLYFYSADGYAVVYAKSNLCKVFITDPPLEEVTGEDPKITGRSPENNYRISELVGDEYKCIVYLDSFNEFTEYEQKILKELKGKQDTEDEVHDALNVVLEPLGEVTDWYYQNGPYSYLYE
ncbi:MAG: hypothetical protein J6K12_01015 [Clostridia bacterium]|nr:hypothetical protein [Clostridia bacterium]